MNTSIEQRLTDHYTQRTADLPASGPGLPDPTAVRLVSTQAAPGPSHGRTRMLLIGGAAAATIVGLIAFSSLRSDTRTTGPVAQGPGTASPAENQTLEPASQLPDTGDVSSVEVPPTVANVDGPTDWFRLAPDLDIAWYQADGSSDESMVCWRTPVDQQCMVDDNSIFGMLIPTGGDQVLVLAIGPAEDRLTLELGLSDFTVLTAPIEWSDTIGWGVARFAVPDGVAVVTPGAPGAAVSVTPDSVGATLPPSNDLDEVPVTIMREDGVFSWWRWLPDLDISERQPTAPDAPTEFCWRTPVGEGCIDEAFNSPEVGLIPTDGAVIAVVRPALFEIVPAPDDPLAPTLEAGPDPVKVVATLTDGSTVEAPVEYADGFGLGYARLPVPLGESVVEAVSE